MTDTLYREEILGHYRSPFNFGKLDDFDVSSKQLNPFCGDEIEMFVDFVSLGANTNTHRRCELKNISFLGKGCAVSIASASILTEYVKGKTKKQLTKFSEIDMLGLLGIKVSETRKKCALLGWAVLQDCLR